MRVKTSSAPADKPFRQRNPVTARLVVISTTRNWHLALLAALLLSPASAALCIAQEVVELRGATTLVGSQGAVIRVRVPQLAALTIDRDTEIQGNGDFVGFDLSPYPVQLDAGSPPSPEIGSVLVVGRVGGTVHYQSRSAPQVAAGEYLLYLLADGLPARVTFHLGGLDGALELSPTHPAPFDARVLVPNVTVEADPVIYSAGDGGEVSGPGVGLVLIWLRSQVIADLYPGPSGGYGLCRYAGDPLDETVAYLPGCPLQGQPPAILHVLSPGSPGINFGALYHFYPGRWGLGAWYTSPTLVDDSGAGVFWLTLTTPEPPVELVSVVSRKVHGSAGMFEIDLPLTGTQGIECRSGGAGGDYTLVFSFANTLTGVGGASVTGGSGSVSNSVIDSSDAHNYIVNLTGVTNAQTITVALNNVTDSAGNSSSTDFASMAVLLGDTTASRSVNSSDISQTKSQSGQSVTTSNSRQDVTADGAINSSDISLVKSKSGTALP